MKNSETQKIIKDEKGQEVVMIRTDITLKRMMEERPSSRWNVRYWDLSYDRLLQIMFAKYPVNSLDKFIPSGTDGITYGQVGKREYVKRNGIPYVRVSNIFFTGVNLVDNYKEIKKDGWNDPIRSRIKEGDVLIVSSGATIGKITIAPKFFNYGQIVQDIDRVRFNGLNNYYFVVFYKSIFGQSQIDRIKTGTGVEHLDFNEIKSIKIPVLPENIQKNIETEYKKMSRYHDKAMEAKKKGNEEEYKKNIEIAERMLKDLITKTEAVIRGERKDVI